MFSIIIPTYNRDDLLKLCLECLKQEIQKIDSADYEIIVSDDSNNDKTKTLITQEYNWVKWISGPKKGPAANRNHGAKNAKNNWLIFIDDDCLPNKNLLINYQKAIADHPGIFVFEGCIKADRAQKNLAEESPINETGGYLWSCNFMINKDLFLKKLDGFDENFPYAAMEDVDLDYRIKQNEIKKTFVKEAFVIHPWRLQKHMWRITLNRFESTLYFLKKHPERKMDINSRYYLMAFYNSFFKNTVPNSFKYHFKGVFKKITYDIMQLYFAIYIF